jgi:hypothetical protein
MSNAALFWTAGACALALLVVHFVGRWRQRMRDSDQARESRLRRRFAAREKVGR